MPLIEVKLFDFRMSEETSARLIEKMTTPSARRPASRACASTRG